MAHFRIAQEYNAHNQWGVAFNPAITEISGRHNGQRDRLANLVGRLY